MTLQQMADYAMDYLDSKGIAAEYEISHIPFPILFNPIVISVLVIEFNERKIRAADGENFDSVKCKIDAVLSE